MTAYARLVNGGPWTETICPQCGLLQRHPRTAPAQIAARTHNRTIHAYPQTTLDIGAE